MYKKRVKNDIKTFENFTNFAKQGNSRLGKIKNYILHFEIHTLIKYHV